MAGLTPEEEEKKKAVFEAMSARSRKRILDKGYEQWDPFMAPKDPLDLRMARQKENALSLTRKFMYASSPDHYSNAYGQGAWEASMGLAGGDDRWRGIYDFCCWYRDLPKKGEL